MITKNLLLLNEEFLVREAEVFDFYEPGRKVVLAGVICHMMSVRLRGGINVGNPETPDSNLPLTACIYSNDNGDIMDIYLEWSDIAALNAMAKNTD